MGGVGWYDVDAMRCDVARACMCMCAAVSIPRALVLLVFAEIQSFGFGSVTSAESNLKMTLNASVSLWTWHGRVIHSVRNVDDTFGRHTVATQCWVSRGIPVPNMVNGAQGTWSKVSLDLPGVARVGIVVFEKTRRSMRRLTRPLVRPK